MASMVTGIRIATTDDPISETYKYVRGSNPNRERIKRSKPNGTEIIDMQAIATKYTYTNIGSLNLK